LKPEITQKVESVPSLKTHLFAIANPERIASPGKAEGLPKQTSLFGNHRSRISAVMAGLALSIGAYGSLVASHRINAIAAESAPLDTIGISAGNSSSPNNATRGTGENSYIQQIRNEVSNLRNVGGQDGVLLAQAVANRGNIGGSNRFQISTESSVSIPVPAPKIRTFKRPTPTVATAEPYFSTPAYNGYNGGAGEHSLPEDNLPTTGTTSLGFAWPARGKLTSGYGRRWGRMHRGIDIAAPIGTPVYAAADGVVVDAGWNSGGYGNLVEIRHSDGTTTRYGHNSRIRVATGQQVRQGQQIADMGSTGRSTGSHVHFEIRPQGAGAVNPIAFLPSSR
jgi:murein DD-endopeptidase MepM/ murein hydrolase activator NlpD